jgi:hypothetical protein
MLLYKYRSSEYMNMFQTWEVIFSPPSQFADPFECRPVSKTIADEAVRMKAVIKWFRPSLQKEIQAALKLDDNPDIDKPVDGFYDRYFGEKRSLSDTMLRYLAEESIANSDDKQVGVFSLSATCNSPLMWEQYADGHRGFVVGLNSADRFFKAREHGFGRPMRVQYSTERPTWSWATLAEPNRFLTKSVNFMYEQEWRVLRKLNEGLDTLAEKGTPETLGLSLLGVRPQRFRFRLNPTSVSRVILGARMAIEDQLKIVDIIHADSRLRKVRILCAQVDEREYRMNIKPAPSHIVRGDRAPD